MPSSSRRKLLFSRCACFALCAIYLLGLRAVEARGAKEEIANTRSRCFIVELYISDDSKASKLARTQIETFIARNKGYKLYPYDIQRDEKARERLSLICRHFKRDEATPRAYGGGTPITDFADQAAVDRTLEAIATLTVYVRAGCPRCNNAKKVLPEFARNYPALRIRFRDIVADPQANEELQALVRRHRAAAASVPVFHLCNELSIGFNDALSMGNRLHTILKPWTVPCPVQPDKAKSDEACNELQQWRNVASLFPAAAATLLLEENSETSAPPPPAELPLPGSDENNEIESVPQDEIELPVFGRLKVQSVGLPVFTIAVGLVDGFNPCAMWVLLFLLSVLVNLRSRWKILAVAGTFVVISAAAYFAFMAAWFSVFRFVGVLREVQIAIAAMAICIGLIHVKDFFAFKQGITLSIPESAKPGIYDRVRRIVTAENLVGAIVATSILAVLVNIVELLCTAGLPAVYTQILTAQQLPQWQNYAYLLLYDLAYMFDDGLMVALVVITLDRHKLQEKHGRWLKLLSGTAILMLGIVMLVRPQWLGM